MATNVQSSNEQARRGQHVRLRLEERIGTLPARVTIEVRTGRWWWSLDGRLLPPKQPALRLVSAPSGWWERDEPYRTPSTEPSVAPEASDGSQRQSWLFERWPRTAARRPWPVLIGTLIVLVALGVLFAGFGGRYTDNFSLPGTELTRISSAHQGQPTKNSSLLCVPILRQMRLAVRSERAA